jgi:predicted permease
MRKTPAFALAAIVTLALGIGANSAIFAAINAVFFHPLPVRAPERLVSLFTTDQRNQGGLNNYLPVSHPNAEDIQKTAQSFSGVSLYSFTNASMTINGEATSLTALVVSGNYFDVLGIKAAKGRTFLPEEDGQPGSGPVIVLSHGLWERKFGSSEKIIGSNLIVNGQGFTVIGVAPQGFQGLDIVTGPDLWVPVSMHNQVFSGLQKTYFDERRFLGFFMVGRLKETATMEQARQELRTIGVRLERDFPLPNRERSFTAVPLLQASFNPNMRGLLTRASWLIMTVVGLVLLIACCNIANLLLTRAAGRKREISIRLAVGASRSRIVAQLITEAIVLAVAGGALGLGLAVLGRNLLWNFRPPFLQQAQLSIPLDGTVLLFTIVITLGTGLIFGLVPALQASSPDLVMELKERAGGEITTGRRFGFRNLVIVVQVALSLVALSCASLFMVSLHNAQRLDPGFDTHNLAMISFDLGSLNYDPARAKEFERRLLEAARAMPGINSATLASTVPLSNGGFFRSVFPEGQDGSSTRNGVIVNFSVVDTDYLQVMGIPLLKGRNFDSSVREESYKVAIINSNAAQRFWPNEDPVGKRFKFFGGQEWVQVIGVSRDSKYVSLGEDPAPYMYLPLIQNPSSAMTLFFRGNSGTAPLLSAMRGQIHAFDSNLPLTNAWPIGEIISQALWSARFGAGVLAIFALIAVLLCAVGIYGVVEYTVSQKIREIGIRMALGAGPRDILMMVLRQSSKTIGIGLAVGAACSYLLAHFIANLLYGVSVNAPWAFLIVASLLGVIGLLASYIPARQASTVDPMVVLHQ